MKKTHGKTALKKYVRYWDWHKEVVILAQWESIIYNFHMPNKIIINGEFYCNNLTGIERVATDTIPVLDKLASPNEIELVIPKNARNIPELKNISVVQLDCELHSFPKWQQFVFQKYIRKNHGIALDFGNAMPYFCSGISYIHDIYCKLFPEDFPTKQDKKVRLYNCLMYHRIAKKAKKIIAVSEYTKKTIMEAYHVPSDRIEVIYNALSPSYITTVSDEKIFEKFPVLKEKEFYFTLGSLSIRKNLKWIADHAALYPNEFFAISGKILENVIPQELESLKTAKNVLFLGYLSDAEVKAVMARCKAFIFPSYFEGFGIPPLEALSCGAKIIIADSSCLPEIYGDTAYYIHADEPNVNLDGLLKKEVASPESLLKKLTIENTAEKLYKILKDYI